MTTSRFSPADSSPLSATLSSSPSKSRSIESREGAGDGLRAAGAGGGDGGRGSSAPSVWGRGSIISPGGSCSLPPIPSSSGGGTQTAAVLTPTAGGGGEREEREESGDEMVPTLSPGLGERDERSEGVVGGVSTCTATGFSLMRLISLSKTPSSWSLFAIFGGKAQSSSLTSSTLQGRVRRSMGPAEAGLSGMMLLTGVLSRPAAEAGLDWTASLSERAAAGVSRLMAAVP